jgi:hypothetical protein
MDRYRLRFTTIGTVGLAVWRWFKIKTVYCVYGQGFRGVYRTFQVVATCKIDAAIARNLMELFESLNTISIGYPDCPKQPDQQ